MKSGLGAERIDGLLGNRVLMGAKLALVCGDGLVAYLRDDFAHIPDPGRWDLPGGVREPGETILACALRETREEFGIDVSREMICHAARFVKFEPHRIEAAFLVARVPQDLIAAIVFGEEGQRWELMPVPRFISNPMAVRELQACVATWWDGGG